MAKCSNTCTSCMSQLFTLSTLSPVFVFVQCTSMLTRALCCYLSNMPTCTLNQDQLWVECAMRLVRSFICVLHRGSTNIKIMSVNTERHLTNISNTAWKLTEYGLYCSQIRFELYVCRSVKKQNCCCCPSLF